MFASCNMPSLCGSSSRIREASKGLGSQLTTRSLPCTNRWKFNVVTTHKPRHCTVLLSTPRRNLVRPRGGTAQLAVAEDLAGSLGAPLDRELSEIKDGDVIYTESAQGTPMWLEVQHVEEKPSSGFLASASGYDVRGTFSNGGKCQIEILGRSEIPDQLFSKLRFNIGVDTAEAAKEVMSSGVENVLQKGAKVEVGAAKVVQSYQTLWDAVKENADPWVTGGEGSQDPVTSQAGEILSLIHGRRGVVVVQLWTVKDKDAGNSLHNPLTLRAIREALQDKNLDIKLSLADTPEGDPLALSLVLHAKKAPFDSWAAHLAQLGVQSALVADTPMDKLMIGRILGYSEPNIQDHIQSKGQECTPEIEDAVSKDLKKLSDADPTIPWRDIGNAVPSAKGTTIVKVSAPKSGFGGKPKAAKGSKGKGKGSKKKR